MRSGNRNIVGFLLHAGANPAILNGLAQDATVIGKLHWPKSEMLQEAINYIEMNANTRTQENSDAILTSLYEIQYWMMRS